MAIDISSLNTRSYRSLYGSVLPNIFMKVPNPERIFHPSNPVIRQKHKERATKDFAYFSEYCCGYILAPFHMEWFNNIHSRRRVVYMSSRSHAKTTIASILYPLWDGVLRRPAIEYYTYTANKDLATILNSRFDNHLDLPIFQDPLLWPNITLVDRNIKGWNKSLITLGHGTEFNYKGFASATRGPHPHVIIVDDILTDKTYLTDEMIHDIFFKAISPMPKEKLIVIGTPQHYQDILHKLFENKKYYSKKYPAIIDAETKHVLWPEEWPWEKLMEEKETIGELPFTQEYLCEPIDDATSLFPYAMCSNNFTQHAKLGQIPENTTTVMGCDLALSESRDASFSVFTVLAVYDDWRVRYADVWKARGKNYKEQLLVLRSMGERYNPLLIYVEDNQFQKMFVQMLDDVAPNLNIEGIRTGSEKHNIELGVPSIRQFLEQKRLEIPRGDELSISLTNELVQELVAFGVKDGKVRSVAKHDDMVMSLWMACRAVADIKNKEFWFGSLDVSFGKVTSAKSRYYTGQKKYL